MLPHLAKPYADALQAALEYIHTRYAPTGILLSGSIIRGNPHPASDLDFVVVHPQSWRQRTQRWFGNVPGEMFVNPPFELERAMHRDATSGRPIMPHMLATGVILHDPDDVVHELQQLAEELLAKGPACSAESLNLQRYAIATWFEDAGDIAQVDPDLASTFITGALLSSVRLMFLDNGRWIPRHKLLLSEFERRYPDWGTLVRDSLRCTSVVEQLEMAAPFIQHVAGMTGFFEWESAYNRSHHEATEGYVRAVFSDLPTA
jgi:hypothetical protein